jgi:hydrogenase expression/formation protein HypC
MCLAVPGKIISVDESNPATRTGKVAFGGIAKEVNLDFVPEAQTGDYVIVHVGFALSKVDEEEANRVFEYLRQMNELEDLAQADNTNTKP